MHVCVSYSDGRLQNVPADPDDAFCGRDYYMHVSGGLFVDSAWLRVYQLNTLNEEERRRLIHPSIHP